MLARAARTELRGARLGALLVAGAVGEVAVAALAHAVGVDELVGVHSVFGIAIATMVAMAGGWLAGGTIAALGAGGFLLAIDGDTSVDPILDGLPVVVVWVVLACTAGVVASALRRDARQARLAETASRERAERLYQTVEHLAAAREPGEVARIAAHEGALALRASGAWVGVHDPERNVIEQLAAVGFPDQVVDRYRQVPVDAPFVSVDVVRDGQARWFEDADAFALAYPAGAAGYRAAGFEASACLPLRAEGSTLGFITLLFRERRAFPQDERELALAFSSTAGQALERSRLFAAVRGAAEVLQRSLLPGRLPDVQGFDVAARYRPASDAVVVGGDWYEVIDVGGGRLGIAVGDVGGKGIDAAAVMGKLRTAMRAYALEHASPARVLEHLAEYHAATRPDAFATVIYAVLDPAEGELRLASAGHLAPIVATSAGASWLEIAVDPPLGAGVRRAFRETRAALADGDLVVLFTDGVVERRDEAIDVGVGEIAALAAATDGVPTAVLADRMLEAVLGADAFDDRALLVARVGAAVPAGSAAPGSISTSSRG